MGYILPVWSGRPAEIRQDLEQNLLDCDALIVIYGSAPVTWVREQLRQYRRIASKRRERPLRAVAVYEGPPEPKAPLDLSLPNMKTINGHKGLNEAELQSFLDGLQLGVNS